MLHKYLDPLMDDGCLVATLLEPGGKRPPAEPGVYFVSSPFTAIYVGKTGGKGGLWDRIGEMVSVINQTYSKEGGWRNHSGGSTIRSDAADLREVLDYDVQWRANPPCLDCAEHQLYAAFGPRSNSAKVHPCKEHVPPLELKEASDE